MGNLRHAWRALLACAAALLVSAASPAHDHNDRVWFFDVDPQTGAVQHVGEVPGGFKTAVVSWNVATPGGSAIDVGLRARFRDRWTRWYSMGVWSADSSSGLRHSVADQKDADGSVDTDTLVLNTAADAFEVRVTKLAGSNGTNAVVRLVAVATSLAPQDAPELRSGTTSTGAGATRGGAGRADARAASELDVPERTQRIPTSPDAKGGGGDSWCSPASVSMVMAYWARTSRHPEWDVDVASVADGVYDPVYDGCGNWPFNVAFASEHGLAGFVRQLPSLADVELLVSRGIPVIASIEVKPGDLDGAPYPKTAGHLLVIRGFTAAGDVIVNDPYGATGAIRREYRRAQFEHVWQGGSNGTVYIIAPTDVVRSLR